METTCIQDALKNVVHTSTAVIAHDTKGAIYNSLSRYRNALCAVKALSKSETVHVSHLSHSIIQLSITTFMKRKTPVSKSIYIDFQSQKYE